MDRIIELKVFCHEIPVSSSGAGKVDRCSLKKLVLKLAGEDVRIKDSLEDARSVDSIVSKVLRIADFDDTSSFVELGGDSALAVQLLFLLRAPTKLERFSSPDPS